MEATTPSITPVGKYQKSIDGTVTNIPPRLPTIGKRPISVPTGNAVAKFETNVATNIPIANRVVLYPLERNAFTMKKDIAPMTAILKTFAPKVVMPPSTVCI